MFVRLFNVVTCWLLILQKVGGSVVVSYAVLLRESSNVIHTANRILRAIRIILYVWLSGSLMNLIKGLMFMCS